MGPGWAGTQNFLVHKALDAYYNTKTKNVPLEKLQRMVTDAGTTGPSIAAKRSVWKFTTPHEIRVKTKVYQKYSVYNLGNTIAYLKKIDAHAKRELRASVSQAAVAGSGFNETAMVLLAVGDELASQTPAGTTCTQCWEPGVQYTGTPWYMPTNSFTDSAGNDNVFTQLRNWHARMQFMPWWHTTRNPQTVGTNGAPDTNVFSGDVLRTTAGVYQGTTAAGSGLGSDIILQGLHVPSSNMIGSYLTNSYSDGNWKFVDTWNAYKNAPAGMTLAWSTTQTTVPPVTQASTSTENLRGYAEYREEKRGPLDRWWRRKAKRLPPLAPGEAFSFKKKYYSNIAPWRMGLVGLQDQTSTYIASTERWTKLLDYTTGALGMGFYNALTNGAGAPLAILNQAGLQNASYPLRLVMCKKTDPMGSPMTADVTTLILRGNTIPHNDTTPPAASGDFVSCGPAQIMVKRETFWAAKLYVQKRRETTKPHVVDNQGYYDTDPTKYVNFFKTSPAQAGPYAAAQP